MQIKNIISYPHEGQFIAALFFNDAGEARVILSKDATPTAATFDAYNKFLDDPYSYSEKVEDADTAVDVL